jgi:hypothetical protein
MTRTQDRSVKMNFRATGVRSPSKFASLHRDGELNLILEPLCGAQPLGEGKWHETFGLTPR